MDALNLLRSGKASAELKRGNIEWLAILLLAASKETTVADDLRKQLSANAAGLGDCIAATEEGRRERTPSFGEGKDTFCRSVVSGGDVGFASAGLRVTLESEAPFVVVGVRRGSQASFLFVPLQRGSPGGVLDGVEVLSSAPAVTIPAR
jgi:hypothetical protein